MLAVAATSKSWFLPGAKVNRVAIRVVPSATVHVGLIHRRVCITRCSALSWCIMASFHVSPSTFSVRPNPSLNADVPHAGLRPGSGPPVSLFR